MPFNGSINLAVDALLTGAPDIGESSHKLTQAFLYSLTDGTGINQAQNMYVGKGTITGAGTFTYDLAGSLQNALGQTVTFTAIKAIILVNTGTAPITYGGGTNALRAFFADVTDKLTIPAGGMMTLIDPTAAGQTVTAGTGDIVLIAGTDVAWSIIFIGE